MFGLPIVLLAAVGWGVAVFLERPSTTLVRDADLCPAANAISGRTVLLLDLRKPLSERGRALLGEALRQVASALAVNAELRVFALSGTDAAPRQRIDRLCRPYDDSATAPEATAAPQQPDDCDSLPADLPERDAALRFCARRDALEGRIEDMARLPSEVVANAFLVEAIEETSLEFADLPGPKALVVFSDMVQHAPWYSQTEESAALLGFAEFDRLRAQQSERIGERPPPLLDVDVTIFYLPRIGITESPQKQSDHKRFWREYVADAFRTAPVINDLPAMPPFEAVPFSDLRSEPESPNAEWRSLQREREEAERLLEVVERERVALEQARVDALERAEQLEREAAIRRQRELEATAAAEERSATNSVAQQPAGTSPEALLSPPLANVASADANAASAFAEESDATLPVPAFESAANLAAYLDEDAESSAQPPPPPPDPLSQPELPPIAATVVDAPVGPPCPLTPKRKFQGAVPEYPEEARRRFGVATITISYMVDEQGETVDNDVSVVESQSTARPEQFLDLFARQASEFVQRLEFDFEADAACIRRQENTTTFQFNYR